MKGFILFLLFSIFISVLCRKKTKIITGITRLGLLRLNQPESLLFDDNGFLYTGLSDGTIHKVNVTDGSSVVFARAVSGLTPEQISQCGTSVIHEPMCGRVLGMTWDSTKTSIIFMDAYNGVKRIRLNNPENVELITDSINGIKMKFPNSVIASKDGETIYFTDSSKEFVRYQFLNTVLKNHNDGRLIKYNLNSGETEVLAEGIRFANGIDFGKDEKYIVIAETSQATIWKYTLKGRKRGTLKKFTSKEELNCYCDNIKKTSDGHFLVGCFGEVTPLVDHVQQDERLSDLVLSYVPPAEILGSIKPKGIIKKIDKNGRIVEEIIDPTGAILSAVAEGDIHGDNIYIGSVFLPYLGKININTQLSEE